MKIIFTLFLIGFPWSFSKACDYPDWSISKWVEKADAIYYGQVISLSVAKESSNFDEVFDIPDNDIEPQTLSDSIDKDINFRVLRMLKGSETKDKEIKAMLSWCGGGGVEFLGYAVFVKHNNVWTSFNKQDEIDEFLNIAQPESE